MSWFTGRQKEESCIGAHAPAMRQVPPQPDSVGLMQDWPLTIDKIITHAKRTHPWREVISRGAEGDLRRSNYGEIYDQAKRVSAALLRRGIQSGDRRPLTITAAISKIKSQNGGCRIKSKSLTRSRSEQPARSIKKHCAACSSIPPASRMPQNER